MADIRVGHRSDEVDQLLERGAREHEKETTDNRDASIKPLYAVDRFNQK
jgi:hypothetical protein